MICPGCARPYDDTRLAGGRTLHCACGARVGVPLRTGLREGAGEPRFLADVMLERLARWLRALGYDAAWEAQIEDGALVRRGVEEGRWILTRDRRLPREWLVDSILLVRGDRPLQQLREVAAVVPLRGDRLFTRCTRCNVPLRPVDPHGTGAAAAPAGAPITSCPNCRRRYWEGGHTARMRRSLEAALGPGEEQGGN